MSQQPGRFWAYVAVLAGFPLTLAGLSAGLGYLAVPFAAPPSDALTWALGVMAAMFLGLVVGPLALFHGVTSLLHRPSRPMRLPAIQFFGILFALTLGLGLALLNFRVAEKFLFPPIFLLGAALPPLSAVAWAARRLGWPVTWRQAGLALAAGSTLSVMVAIALEVGLGLVTWLLMAPVRYNVVLPGDDFVSRLFFSPALALFLIATALQAPIPEEFAKALGSTLFGRQRITSERQAFVVGMAAGAGFAVLENMMYEGLYAPQAGWGWGSVTLLRGLAAAVHPIGAALVTLGWYRAREKGWGALLKSYAVAVGLHTLWNGGFSVFVYVTGLDYYSRSAIVSLYGQPIQAMLVAFLAVLSLGIWWLLRHLVLGLAEGVAPDLSPVIISRRALATWAVGCALVAVPLGATLGPAYAPIYSVVLTGLPTPTPTPIPTATRTATPTRTSTPGRSPTPVALQATAITRPLTIGAAASAQWPQLLLDDFADNANRWPVGDFSGALVQGTSSVGNGKYQTGGKALGGVTRYSEPQSGSGYTCDQRVTVEARRVFGSELAGYGLMFRGSSGNYYLFLINDRGNYWLQVRVSSGWISLTGTQPTSAIRPGQVNRITAVAEGTGIWLFVNDQLVASPTDSNLACGFAGVAFTLQNSGDEGVFDFDNFEIRSPDAAPTPTPLTTPSPSQTPTASAMAIATAMANWRTTADAFNSNANQWPIGAASVDRLELNRSLAVGAYRWDLQTDTGGLATAVSRLNTGPEFALSVDGRRISGASDASYGLVFRYLNQDNYYLFRITDDRYYVLQVQYKGQLRNLGAWVRSRAIQPGEVNRLAVTALGSHFDFSVNGSPVGDADDGSISDGRAGLVAGLLVGGEAVVEFDNLELRAP